MAPRKPRPHRRDTPFPSDDVSRARKAVAAKLIEASAEATVDDVLNLYDFFRKSSPGHSAAAGELIDKALAALESVRGVNKEEFMFEGTLGRLKSAVEALRRESSMREAAVVDAVHGRFAKLILEGQGIPNAWDSGWRPRFAYLAEDVGLGPTDMARVEALAVIRGDQLLLSHTDPGTLYFEDATAAVQRWKTLCRRRRHAESSGAKRKRRPRGGT